MAEDEQDDVLMFGQMEVIVAEDVLMWAAGGDSG